MPYASADGIVGISKEDQIAGTKRYVNDELVYDLVQCRVESLKKELNALVTACEQETPDRLPALSRAIEQLQLEDLKWQLIRRIGTIVAYHKDKQ